MSLLFVDEALEAQEGDVRSQESGVSSLTSVLSPLPQLHRIHQPDFERPWRGWIPIATVPANSLRATPTPSGKGCFCWSLRLAFSPSYRNLLFTKVSAQMLPPWRDGPQYLPTVALLNSLSDLFWKELWIRGWGQGQ